MPALTLGAFLAAGLSAIGVSPWLIDGVLIGLFVVPFLWVIGLFLLRYKYVEYLVYDEGVLTYDSRLGRVRRAVRIGDVTGLETYGRLTGWSLNVAIVELAVEGEDDLSSTGLADADRVSRTLQSLLEES